jgi:hypothetical protein
MSAVAAAALSRLLSSVPASTGVCVLLLQDLLQSCARGGRRRVEDMCYERRRAESNVGNPLETGMNERVP